MKALIFPGQGCQKQGMGEDLYNLSPIAKDLFMRANAFLNRDITEVMFNGNEIELMETKNTQLVVFLYEVALALSQDEIKPDFVAGHSLGEFAALVINKTVTFEDGLNLVLNRALIAQEVCDKFATSMGAIIGLPDEYIKKRLNDIVQESGEPVYFANYNGPGQVVITGSKKGVRLVCKTLKAEGAKKAIPLAIGGSFHSPFMEEARFKLGKIILNTKFNKPTCPIIQSVDAKPHTDVNEIKLNLIDHITHSVLWTDMVNNMYDLGVREFYEVGTDDTLQKIVKRMLPQCKVDTLLNLSQYKGKIKDFSINK